MSRSTFTSFNPPNHKYNPDFALPGSRSQYNPDKIGELKHIFLDIAVDLEEKSCAGWSITTIAPYAEVPLVITLDAVDMEIFTVKINDEITPFEYDGKQVQILLNSPLAAKKDAEIAIEYRVLQPTQGMTFVSPTKHYPNKPLEMWTQGESEGSRHWFPCFDFPAKTSSTEIRVRTDARFTAVSNGELMEERVFEAGGKPLKLWHFLQKDPHPNYLIFLGIGDYAIVKDHYETVPLRYIGPKGSEELLRLNGQKTPKMIKFLEDKYGVKFPWVKYDQLWATDFIWGGMENTSCTVITSDRGLADRRAALDVNFPEMVVEHELAHQWFGDLVVVKHWANLWIKEGAATYSESMWQEHEYGTEAADYYRLNEIRDYLGYAAEYQRPVETNFYRHPTDLYDGFSYSKAGLVYHMIRTELGEDGFWQSLQRFLMDNAHQPVEPVDLLRAIEKTTGRNLRPLLDQYIFSSGHPDFKISYAWDSDSSLVKLTITQKQAKKDDPESLFDLKIPIAFGFVEQGKSTPENAYNDGTNSATESDSPQDVTLLKNNGDSTPQVSIDVVNVRIFEAEQTLYFPLSKKPDFISFDHGNNYLKTVELQFPIPELEKQLLYAPDVIARVFAAQSLSKKGGLQALNILKKAFETEKFWGVRLEIIRRISEIKLDQTFAAILPGLHDSAPQVRRIAISSLSQFKTLASWLQVKKVLENGDESYLVEMQACASFGVIAGSDLLSSDIRRETFEILQSKLQTADSWAELVRQGVIRGLSALRFMPEVVDVLLEKTKPGNHIDLRRVAISSIGELSQYQSDSVVVRIIDVLDELSSDQNLMIQMGLVAALEQMNTSLAIPVLSQLKNQSVDTRVLRDAEVAILTVQKRISSQKSFVDIRKQLEKIQKENQELKSQMQEVLESLKANKKHDADKQKTEKESVKNPKKSSEKESQKTSDEISKTKPNLESKSSKNSVKSTRKSGSSHSSKKS